MAGEGNEMNESLSPEALERLRALLAKATPGEWLQAGESDPLSILSAPSYWQVAAVNDALLEAHANAELIATAISILPALLSDYERLWKVEEAVMAAPVGEVIETKRFGDEGDILEVDLNCQYNGERFVRLVIVPEREA